MKIGDRTVLVCDCAHSIALDGAALGKACGGGDSGDGAVTVHSQLCRAQLDRFEAALATGQPLLVACTQEAPLFSEVAAEGAPDAALSFTNIRERAGWSDEGAQALPKIAALLAEAALPIPPTGALTLRSEGGCLVYGSDERAIEAGRELAKRLDVTILLTSARDIPPPPVMDAAIFRGRIRAARGWLGAFEIVVDDYAPALPSSRGALGFEPVRQGASARCDLILDLTGGTPLFPDHKRRDGYLRPDPNSPAQVAKALLEIADLVGEFDKPRYVDFKAELCAHSRSRKTGCTRCLDVCPTGAVTPNGDHVAIDPHVCAGCGSCAAVCPTGAATYALPPAATVHERLRTLLGTYAKAGGKAPALLIHDPRHGDALVGLMARHGRGLPARVLPFALNEVTQVGFDLFALALAYGCTHVRVLTGPENEGETAGLASQVGLAEAAFSGLGYGSGRVAVIDAADPDAVADTLWALPADAVEAGMFLPMGSKRGVTMLALRHLHKVAPAPVEVLALPPGAPFGRVAVDVEGCTLCLACVGACPTGALLDNADKPMLSFAQDACVQCGLCRTTCPEKVISLVPEIDFRDRARGASVIKEEEPFCCVSCGKPFASRSSIEKIVTALAGKHPMFATPEAANRIRMCEDCRVRDQFERVGEPFALGRPPVPRTTDDDLREREEAMRATQPGAVRQKLV
ncbi:4Fe-4S ferredoxin, iron-sulfur binding [Azospirillum sp. B510]|uniref:4Fe-4S dicluster domain-containing protein n=1 Tax=Azospirillum sp. (strain B510) TaxID=137722 RepID=UPI0001C4C1B2|nr:4Fe-4S dicluster domain-containing protein [Azospirillum sp. B510]BAI71360.1 4Fe-4S ferredoxin, iron-sulfur binding [Azospirillum sp. B510]